jgi:hypothetical protein
MHKFTNTFFVFTLLISVHISLKTKKFISNSSDKPLNESKSTYTITDEEAQENWNRGVTIQKEIEYSVDHPGFEVVDPFDYGKDRKTEEENLIKKDKEFKDKLAEKNKINLRK